jgi:hypothetical protein
MALEIRLLYVLRCKSSKCQYRLKSPKEKFDDLLSFIVALKTVSVPSFVLENKRIVSF